MKTETNNAAQHTPGPWVLDYDKGSTRDILSRQHGGICMVRRAGRHNDPTFLANCNLIAAAPQLLAALESLANYAEAARDCLKQTKLVQLLDAESAPIAQARQAIAAAKGSI